MMESPITSSSNNCQTTMDPQVLKIQTSKALSPSSTISFLFPINVAMVVALIQSFLGAALMGSFCFWMDPFLKHVLKVWIPGGCFIAVLVLERMASSSRASLDKTKNVIVRGIPDIGLQISISSSTTPLFLPLHKIQQVFVQEHILMDRVESRVVLLLMQEPIAIVPIVDSSFADCQVVARQLRQLLYASGWNDPNDGNKMR